MNSKLLITFLLFVFGNITVAQDFCNLKPTDSLPIDPTLKYGILANGLTYYIKKVASDSNKIHLELVIKVGAIQEDDDQQEQAHLLEHIGMKGSRNFPKGLYYYLESVGIDPSGSSASTSHDQTTYMMSIPSEDNEILNKSIFILSGIASDLLIREKDVLIEGNAVIAEWTSGAGLSQRKFDYILPKLLNNSYYAKIFGKRILTTESFKQNAVERFYKDWYRPDLQAIIVVGNINPDSVLQIINKAFGKFKNPDNPRPRTEHPIFVAGKNQLITFADREQKDIAVTLYHKHPFNMRIVQDLNQSLIGRIYSQIASRRFRELNNQYNSPITDVAHSFSDRGINDLDGISTLSTRFCVDSIGQLKSGFEKVSEVLKMISENGFIKEEFIEARQQIFNNLSSVDTSVITLANNYSSNFVYRTAALNPEFKTKLEQGICSEICLEDLNTFARQKISKNNRDIVIEVPDQLKEIIPSLDTLENWIETASIKSHVATNITHKNFIPLVRFGRGKIINLQKLRDIDATEVLLNNGVKIILKSIKDTTENGKLILTGISKRGAKNFENKYYLEAKNAAGVISNSGIANLNKFELIKYMKEQSLNIVASVEDFESRIKGEVAHKSGIKCFEDLLLLMQQYFIAPVKNYDAFKDWQTLQKKKYNRLSTIDMFNDQIVQMTHGTPSFASTVDIDRLDYEKIYEIYMEIFGNASDFTFVLTGDFNTDQVLPILQKYLGVLPVRVSNTVKYSSSTFIPNIPLNKTFYSPLTVYPEVNLQFINNGKRDDITTGALRWILRRRLIHRLREQEEGIYYVGVSEWNNSYNGTYAITINFSSNIESVDRHILAVKDEVKRLQLESVNADQVKQYIAMAKDDLENYMKSNLFWNHFLSTQYLRKEEINETLNYSSSLDKLTPESIKSAAREYLSNKVYMQFILMPEGKN